MVQITDVTVRDQAVVFNRPAFAGITVVGEFRIVEAAHVNLPDFICRCLGPIFTNNLQGSVADRTANCARMGQPFCTVAMGDHAAFGTAIELMNDRSPPVDHRPLDVWRADRTGVYDVFKTRKIIRCPDRVR